MSNIERFETRSGVIKVLDAWLDGALTAIADHLAGFVTHRMPDALLVIDQWLAEAGFHRPADKGLLLVILRGAATCQSNSR